METRKSRKRKRRQENKQVKETAEDTPKNENVSSENSEASDAMETAENENSLNSRLTTGEVLEILKSEVSEEETHANGGHRAGYDAFMTGFIYAVFRASDSGWVDKTDEWKNKLYLGGKDYPLSVTRSSFSKHSKQHLEKISAIRKTDVQQ